ncbi:MAG: glutamate racemase [Haliea sp.]|nr:glutamate racemase [Haliea sp.]
MNSGALGIRIKEMTDNSNTTRTIGVFDSGVGGLSVLKAIRESDPSVDLIYIADSANAPYGNRSAQFIELRAKHIARSLVSAGAQIIVVACNTATAVAIQMLRSELTVPVVAMEPAIRLRLSLRTKSGVIGILATERTLESAAVERLCREFGKDASILLRPCPGLVELVECGNLTSEHTRQTLQGIVHPLIAQGVDTLVLGCTHYVFLGPTIQDIVGPEVKVLESSAVRCEASQRHWVGASPG